MVAGEPVMIAPASVRQPALNHHTTVETAALGISIVDKRAPAATVIILAIIPHAEHSHWPSLNSHDADRPNRIYANHARPMTVSVSIVRACDGCQPKRNAKRY